MANLKKNTLFLIYVYSTFLYLAIALSLLDLTHVYRKRKKPRNDHSPSNVTVRGGIEQSANVMGANDYEPQAFRLIREKLEVGELSPTAAVNQAQGILDNKQDYH